MADPSTDETAIDLSIVVPLYRCAQTVEELTRRIHATLAGQGLCYEILLVDDASPDGTRAAAERAVALDPSRARLIKSEVRRGQQQAVLAGLRQARGRLWAAMDGDLQDPPELLPELVSELENRGARVAFAARRGGHGSWLRALTSGVFKTLIAKVAGSPRDAGMYFVARREFLEPSLPKGDQWLWFPALLGAIGGVVRVPFDRPSPIENRPSAYSEFARLRLGVRAIVYAIQRRVRAGGSLRAALEGLVVAIAATLAGSWVLGRQAFDPGDEGFLYLVARAWAHGSNLYDHFDLLYPPGVHVLSGWALATFGVDLAVYRGSVAALFGVAVGLMVAALRRHGVSRVALAVAMATLVGYGVISFKALPVALVLTAALAALSKERPTPRTLLALGLATGFLAGFREDAAVLVAACAGVAWLRRFRQDQRARGAIFFAASAFAAFGAWVALFAGRAGGREFLQHVLHRFEFLVLRVGQPTAIPWSWRLPTDPSIEMWSFVTVPYQTLILLALDLVVLGILWRRRRELADDPGLRTAAIALAVSILFLPQFLWERRDTPHLRMHLAAFLPAMAASAALLPRVARSALAAAAIGLASYPLALGGGAPVAPLDPEFYPTPSAQAQRLWLREQPPWAGHLREVGGTLIVLWWGPGWYALEDMPMGTRVLSTFARHHDAASVARLVGDLERPTNRWVLAVSGGEAPAPVLEALSAGYEKSDSWGGWELWARRLSACSSNPRSSFR